ncbi:DNA repair protein RecN [Oceanicella actignis]|uniref:DNA repair protein RecN n=1 Tax=Oceanicella actignis TaxID=1189325 RepID=A0A1M7SAR7_9RHOB|nr:DNA repair protein RecN [Oceanicella actignis]SET28771.1 DNA replication and repair protein RecN [Oceanicella actignis]SHN55600.1 DNA repair protein RecN (Recombination protein N) [Oceanicella actignis]
MLRSLEIRDIVLIERLSLDFAPGLNVLTGETGAGKSILLDALGFALGGRGRADMLRAGAAEGWAAAAFELPPGAPARAVLDELGIDAPDDELVLRRRVAAGGRSAAFVNDRRVSTEALRRLAETLVEVHGQHDDRGLLNPRGHRAILDAYAEAEADLARLRAAWRAAAEADAALARARARLEEAARDADFLRHAVAELEELAPEPGEDERLDAERRMLRAAARIREDVARAAQALGRDGAEGAMNDALRWLDGAAEAAEGRLDGPLAALERALAELAEAQAGVEDALEALDLDPMRLEAVEERLFALRALARKHRVQPDELPELARALSARLRDLDAGEDRIAELEQAARAARADYDAAAQALSERRRAAASRLDAEVARELAPLKMERARFDTLIAPDSPGPEGVDRVEFMVAPNPGAPAGPLARIASGGELSRFLLALKVCLAGRGGAQTMIFDEIDRGVGGATADAVGRRLARLAQGAQVLVVTHSPQVAARAAHHFHIAKAVEGGVARTTVKPLSAAEREDELARMLAGESITDAAREAARALLAG